MYDNVSNIKTTNIFESYTGHLNIAPTRVSGQYKIVMTTDGALWLDDYNNRRVRVDMTKKFLPQVANFLKIKTEIVEINNIRYGGFQRLTTKSYHTPVYLNTIRFKERLPRYHVISRVVNEEIADQSKLQKYGMLLQVTDFEKCGITQIMQEIIDECPDYPVYFNMENEQFTISGYSIEEECWKEKTVNTLKMQANQPYVDVFNNRVMLAFKENDMFFPRFLNVEIDFEFKDDLVPFNNFYGYMSYGEEIDITNFNPDLFTINVQDYGDYILWKQEKYTKTIAIEQYRREVGNVSTVKSSLQLPQVRFRCPNVNVEDVFTIYNPDGTLYFQHIVQLEEIKETLYKTLVQLCNKMTTENGRNFVFDVDQKMIVTITSNISDIYEEQYSVSLPNYCVILDRYEDTDENYYKFRGVTSYDVKLSREASFERETSLVEINGDYFNIVERFQYDDQVYIRCVGVENPNDYPVIKEMDSVLFFEILDSKLYTLPVIPIYTVNSTLKALRQFSKEEYIKELKEQFDHLPEDPNQEDTMMHDAFINAVTDFARQEFSDTLPYIAEDENIGEPVENDVVLQDDNNDEEIKTMMFNSFGGTSMLTPNIMNIDKHFYIRNGNTDYNNVDTDPYAFHWFLIKGTCPRYLQNDIRSLRYFGGKDDAREDNNTPKITSRVIRVNENYCETIFMGVKYQLPLRYENWQFAVYVDFQNELDFDVEYKFEVDESSRSMYLVVSRYIDFVDLIRGGNVNNDPLVDLSLFYTAKASYNTQSEFLDGFTSTGILMCDDTIPVMFNGKNLYDWKAQKDGKWYVCLKNSVTTESADFRVLFPEQGDHEFYLYADVMYNNKKYTYISMSMKLKNIIELDENYVWCEDIQVKFFDTKNIFIQKMKDGVTPPEQEWFHVPRENIINYVDQSPNIYGDHVKTATVLIRRYIGEQQIPVDSEEIFELILPAKTLSLTQNYFEIRRQVIPKESGNGNGEIETKYSYFTFPNFFKPGWDLQDLLAQFEIESFDNDTRDSTINLFHRNQLWLFIREYMASDARFKYTTEEQVRRFMNIFLVDNLNTYTRYKSIPITKFNQAVDVQNTHKFGYVSLKVISNDYNSVIWNIITHAGYDNKIFTINRYKAPYLPYLMLLDDTIDFQKLEYRDTGKLYNIYDPDFAGVGLSATTFWNEVQGNVVSSLFCKDSDIVITIAFNQDVNWYEMFKAQLTLDEAIIVNDNHDYIETVDENVNDYILTTYCDYLLFRFFHLAEVQNELGQKLKYSTDQKEPKIIHFPKLSSYETNFHYLKLIFKRK